MIYLKIKFDGSFKSEILDEFRGNLLQEYQDGQVFFRILEGGLSHFLSFHTDDENLPSNEKRKETLRSVQKACQTLQTKIETLHFYDKSVLGQQLFLEKSLTDNNYPDSLIEGLDGLAELCALTLSEMKLKPGRSQGQFLQLAIAVERALTRCSKPDIANKSYQDASVFVRVLDKLLEFASINTAFGEHGIIFERKHELGDTKLARSIAKSYCHKGH